MKQKDIVPTGIYIGHDGRTRRVENFFMFPSNCDLLRYSTTDKTGKYDSEHTITIKSFARWAKEVVK